MKLQIFCILVLAALAVSMTDPREKTVNEVQQWMKPSYPAKPIPSLIDALQQRYLALERDLWHIIDSGIDSAYVLEQIHSVHLNFFAERFGEYNVTFADYALDHQIQLFKAVSNINRNIAMVIKNSLKKNPLAFNERATIDMAQLQLDLTHQIDAIINITASPDFYVTIKNVSNFE